MAITKKVPQAEATRRADQKQTKKKHAGKDWATLNTTDKFEIIGDDLRARGVID